MVSYLQVAAPAKINLTLRVTCKRPDGYHLLDSLVAFTDFGDSLEVCSASDFSFEVAGPFACSFTSAELDSSEASDNIVVRAATALARSEGRAPEVSIRLTKNLPLASGLGGGSADAAAVIRALQTLWGCSPEAPYLPELLKSLGADVPVCWSNVPKRVRGIGEILEGAPIFPALNVVLVNPLKPCPTAEVFRRHQGFHEGSISFPVAFETVRQFAAFLETQDNDLLNAALQVVPEIGDCLEALSAQSVCLISRLSGSGATCFGVFESAQQAADVAERIAQSFPGWWVRAGRVG